MQPQFRQMPPRFSRSTMAVFKPSWLAAPYLAYFTVAAARYYAMSPLQALWRGAAHLAFYVLLVLLPAGLIILATVTDWNAFWIWLQSA